MKKLLTTMLLLTLFTAAKAVTKIDGIYYNLNSNGTAEVTSPCGGVVPSCTTKYNTGSITIPPSVTYDGKTYNVTSIGWYAFSNCTKLTSVTIPESVTRIEEHAFRYCFGLTSVTIENGLTEIGAGAFKECSNLRNIILPATLKRIDSQVFEYCTSLETIIIPASVESMGEYVFAGCNAKVYMLPTTPPTLYQTNGFSQIEAAIGDGNYIVPCDAINAYLSNEVWSTVNTVVAQGQKNAIIIGDINYSLNCERIAEVIKKDDGYTGSIEIPSSVIYDGNTYSVTSIDNSAFYGCTGLTSITIPSSVTNIGDFAFYNCTGLTSIEIPNSVTSIGEGAFLGCKGLTTVTIPNSVTSIGKVAFASCHGLTSVTIGNSVTSIGYGCFGFCHSLTSVTIPNCVTSIGENAFSDCEGLTSINVASDNTVYDSRDNCNAIIETATYTLIAGCQNTVIPNSVTSIGEGAFRGCTGLTSIEIPNSVTSIGENAFSDCEGLTSITIPNSVTSIGSGAFTNIPYVVYAGSATGSPWGAKAVYVQDGFLLFSDAAKTNLVKCLPEATGAIVIPNSVTGIGYKAFLGCTGLTSITIPNSVTSIGENAFGGCTGLTSVTIPNSVTSIGEYAFTDCTSLTSVTIPNSVTSIGTYAFWDCTGLTSVTIPDNVTSIGYNAFYGCTGLTSIEWNAKNCNNAPFSNISANIISFVFGNDVESIPNYLCYGMKNLTSITIPNSVTSIGDGAFSGCTGLTSVTIPNSVTSIGSGAFTNIPYIVYAGSATGSPWGAKAVYVQDGFLLFSDATKINLVKCLPDATGSITLPESVTTINSNAFSNCTGLTSPVFNSHLFAFMPTYYEGAYSIPNGIETIAGGAFRGCTGLTSVTIPNSVTSIGSSAFSGCTGLTSVTIPNSVTSIGSGAFSNISYIVYAGSATGSPWGAKVVCAAQEGYLLFQDAAKTILYICMREATGSITIPNSVTSIDYNAFQKCTGITSVTIPESVTSIGYGAFSGCTGLTSVTIPESVTSIGRGAFSNIPYIVYAGSATGSPWGAQAVYAAQEGYLLFSDAAKTNLVRCLPEATGTIVIPENVTTINSNAFQNCTGITSIVWNAKNCNSAPFSSISANVTSFVFGDEVASIPNNLCSGMENLTSIILPESVTSICSSAFSGCTGLTSPVYNSHLFAYMPQSYNGTFSIPNGIEKIAGGAFSGCTGLTSVTIPNSVTSIGSEAFSGCTGLTCITIPNSVTSIEKNAFYNIPYIVYAGSATGSPWGAKAVYAVHDGYLLFNDAAKTNLVKCLPEAIGNIVIPESVTTINSNAFQNCTEITSIVWNAKNCNSAPFGNISVNITSFVFGNEVESIPSNLCSGMESLTSITIPNSVTTIGSNAFSNCTGLTSVTIPNSVTNIEWGTFSDCMGLKNIIIPNSVMTINSNAFQNCTSLTTVTIPNSVTYIGDYAFSGCIGLTSVTIPNSVTSIEWGTFSDCTGLTSVTIPNGVMSIGESAFYGCSGLTSITIGNGVTDIGDYAFYGCSGLTSVAVAAGNTVYDSRDNCNAIIETATNTLIFGCQGTVIPNGVTKIGSQAFQDCSGLTSVTIPNRVTYIESQAFSGCTRLGSVVLGSGLKTIYYEAFSGCTGLQSITCYSMRPPTTIDSNNQTNKAFETLPYSTIVYVPSDYLTYYMIHDLWGLYDVRSLGAASVHTDDLTVTPHQTTVDITWPLVANAASYDIAITSNGITVCTLTFNAQGQLTNIAFRAPAAESARAAGQGFQFTVTGLEGGSAYSLMLNAKDAAGNVLRTFSQDFSTGATAIEEVNADGTMKPRKILEEGRVIILMPDGRKFDASGRALGK